MSVMHRCRECGEITAVGWGSEPVCQNCQSSDMEDLETLPNPTGHRYHISTDVN